MSMDPAGSLPPRRAPWPAAQRSRTVTLGEPFDWGRAPQQLPHHDDADCALLFDIRTGDLVSFPFDQYEICQRLRQMVSRSRRSLTRKDVHLERCGAYPELPTSTVQAWTNKWYTVIMARQG